MRTLTDQYHVVQDPSSPVKSLDEPGHSRNPLHFSDPSRIERPDHSPKLRQVETVEGTGASTGK